MPPMQMPSDEEITELQIIAEACTQEEVLAILRSDERRNYAIDIETDATSYEDDIEEKNARIEYGRGMTELMMAWLPVMQGNGSVAPFVKELVTFMNGAFKTGRQMEEALEDSFDQIKQMPPQPNPEQQKVEAEAKAKEQEFAMKAKDREQDMLFKAKDHELKQQGMQADLAYKAKELQFKEQELGMKAQESEFNRQAAAESAMFDRQSRQEEMAFKREDAMHNRQAASEDRADAREDRKFQRDLAVHESGEKAKERNAKSEDMRARLTMDQDEQKARRAMEADDVKGEGGMTSRQEIETSVASQIGQVAEAISALQENQLAVVEAIKSLSAKEEETQTALLSALKRMGAPRTIRRDPKSGRAIGVDILEEAS